MSIASIFNLGFPHFGSVYIYMDGGDLFSNNQRKEIDQKYENIKWRKIGPPFDLYSQQTVNLENKVFKSIAKEIDASDYLMEVDSDLLFLDDRVLWRVYEEKYSQAIGWMHAPGNNLEAPTLFMHGACYFLRGDLLEKLVPANVGKLKEWVGWTGCPDDLALWASVVNCTGAITFIPFLGHIEKIRPHHSMVHARGSLFEKKETMRKLGKSHRLKMS